MSLLDQLSGKLDQLSGVLKDKELGDKLSEVGGNVADALNIGANTVYGRAKNVVEVSGLKKKLSDAERDLARACETFGHKYMELHKDDPDPELAGEIEAIKAAEQKTAELRKAIEEAKAAVKAAEADLKSKVQADRQAERAEKERQKAAAAEAEKDEDAGDEFEEEVSDEKVEDREDLGESKKGD